MLRFRETFKNRADFERLKNSRAQTRARFFIANAAPATMLPARYGLVATARNFDTAVKRNRARRLMREWLRLSADKLDPATDYSFVLKSEILTAKREEGMAELEETIVKLKESL